MFEEPKKPIPIGDWAKNRQDAEFHPDESKLRDPVEKLIETYGSAGAADEVLDQLSRDPGNEELRRQANLLATKFEGLAEKIRTETSH